MNPLPAGAWAQRLEESGFDVIEHVPIVPGVTGSMIVLLDQLWHVPVEARPGVELGSEMHEYFVSLPNFRSGLRGILDGLIAMEKDPAIGCGAIFVARRLA